MGTVFLVLTPSSSVSILIVNEFLGEIRLLYHVENVLFYRDENLDLVPNLYLNTVGVYRGSQKRITREAKLFHVFLTNTLGNEQPFEVKLALHITRDLLAKLSEFFLDGVIETSFVYLFGNVKIDTSLALALEDIHSLNTQIGVFVIRGFVESY